MTENIKANGHSWVFIGVQLFAGQNSLSGFLLLIQPNESSNAELKIDKTTPTADGGEQQDAILADLYSVHDFDVNIDLQAAGKVSHELIAAKSAFSRFNIFCACVVSLSVAMRLMPASEVIQLFMIFNMGVDHHLSCAGDVIFVCLVCLL